MRALCEQAVRRSAVVLEVPAPIAHAEAHVRALPGHAELAQQTLEVWVVAVVEHHEAGVHAEGLLGLLDADRVGVAAGRLDRLEHYDLVSGIEQVCRDHARDTGTNDRDPHGSGTILAGDLDRPIQSIRSSAAPGSEPQIVGYLNGSVRV